MYLFLRQVLEKMSKRGEWKNKDTGETERTHNKESEQGRLNV